MNSSAEKILYRKAALIFEELGFLMPRSDSAEFPPVGRISAAVNFSGPFSGCLIVSVTQQILSQLTANMLGDEAQSSELMERDSLAEIANVICGNALPAIYGFDPVFNLDAPTILDDAFELTNSDKYIKEGEVRISFDSGIAAIVLLVANHQTA